MISFFVYCEFLTVVYFRSLIRYKISTSTFMPLSLECYTHLQTLLTVMNIAP
jgi:hypothetical protein